MTWRVSTQTLSVPEISCATCKNAIEGALAPLPGVREATVDVAARSVHVEFDEAAISVDELVAAIVEQGYDVAGRDSDADGAHGGGSAVEAG